MTKYEEMSPQERCKVMVDKLYPGLYSHYSAADVNDDVIMITNRICAEITVCTIEVVSFPFELAEYIKKILDLRKPEGWLKLLTDPEYFKSSEEVIRAIVDWIIGDKVLDICADTVKLNYRSRLELAFLGLM